MKNKPRRISYNGHRYTPKEILTDLEGYVIEAKSTRAEMVNGSSKDPTFFECPQKSPRETAINEAIKNPTKTLFKL